MLRKLRLSQKWFPCKKRVFEKLSIKTVISQICIFERNGLLQWLLQFKRLNLSFQDTKHGMDMLFLDKSEKYVNYMNDAQTLRS